MPVRIARFRFGVAVSIPIAPAQGVVDDGPHGMFLIRRNHTNIT